MPTVVLLDRSLSMRRPAGREDPDQTRHSLACAGLEWFFDYLSQCFPLEYTTLLTFSSTCEVLVPFTRDYAQLKERLADVKVLDRTDIHKALMMMIEVMMAEWGVFAPCQVVLVTDGCPGVTHQDDVHKAQQTFCLPFPCQLHLVCVSTREELMKPPCGNKMDRLCSVAGVNPSDVFVPSGQLGVHSVLNLFKQLARGHYRPFSGVLKCGHLQSRICLTPPPNMYTSQFELRVTPDQKFPKLEDSLGSVSYPHEFSICGFIDLSSFSSPPVYARHFVLDPEAEERSTDRKWLDTGGGGRKVADLSGGEESQKPSFRVLLHGSLKCESKAAVVKLGEHWYGVLYSQSSPTKKSNLLLSVLYRNSDIPWLGSFSYLGPKPVTGVADPRRAAGGPPTPTAASEQDKDVFPVLPPRLPSFQTHNNLLWASEMVLQADVTKVIRYSRKLPDKEASLVKELNKLRRVALTYTIPELTEMLCAVLKKEEAGTTNIQAKTLLQQCCRFLAANKNPQEQLVIAHK